MSIKSNMASGSTSSAAPSLAELKKLANSAPIKTLDSLTVGSIDAVDKAIVAGHKVIKFNTGFKADAAGFGTKQHLACFGGALTCLDDESSAFLHFRPLAYSLNKKTKKKEFIKPGVTTSMFLDITEDERKAILADKNPALANAYLENAKCNEDFDYDMWQAWFADMNVSGEGQFDINCRGHWNNQFIQTLDGFVASGSVRSVEVYFSLQDVSKGEHGVLFKSVKEASLAPIYGKHFNVTPLFVRFSSETVGGGFKGTPVSSDEVNNAFANARALKKAVSAISTDTVSHNNLATTKFGNKAVKNALAVFENGLKDGKWFKAAEIELLAIAASGYFNSKQTPDFYCSMAAKCYFATKQAENPDADVVLNKVAIKASANAIKAQPDAVIATPSVVNVDVDQDDDLQEDDVIVEEIARSVVRRNRGLSL